MKRLKRTPGQTDVRLNSSTRQLASDPRSQTAEPQNNKCDVAASCPHSILVKRLECCADRLNPPAKADSAMETNSRCWFVSFARIKSSGAANGDRGNLNTSRSQHVAPPWPLACGSPRRAP